MALTLTSVFADLPDPRAETANRLHTLTDILTIATCAVIAGAEGWEDIAEYGRSKEAFFRRFHAALQARGLSLKGITTDGSALYPEPITAVFGDVPHQVCNGPTNG